MKAKRLPSGNYRTQIVLGYDENGKRIVKSFTAGTKIEAIKKALDYKENSLETTSNITVEQALTQYIEARNNILSPSTIRGYNIIKNTRLQLIKEFNISELTLNDIQKAVNYDSKRLSRKSVKSAVALLKSALDMQGIGINVKKITLPQAKNTKKPLPNVEDVLRVIVGTELELPCLLAMWLSLRISEVRGLQFKSLKMFRQTVNISAYAERGFVLTEKML